MKYISIAILLIINVFFYTTSYSKNEVVTNESNFFDQFTTEMVTKNVFVIHGSLDDPNSENNAFINNPGFVIANTGVIIVDPGSSAAIGEMLLKRIRQVTSLPVIAIFNTHEHGDHWLANQTIVAAYPNIPIYAATNMIQSVEDGTGKYWLELMQQLTKKELKNTIIMSPTQAVSDGDEIVFDNLTFKVHHYGTSHTKNDIMLEVVELDTVFLGDNVMNKRLPNLANGDIVGNIHAIETILTSDCHYFIPGHGPSGNRSVPVTYLQYLTNLYDSVKHYYHEGLTDFEMKAPIEESLKQYSGWHGFDSDLGKNISLVFLQIERDDF
jgi:glyoxylase-like metal-dependent hydrolase (beta-lactamase superfamily II)